MCQITSEVLESVTLCEITATVAECPYGHGDECQPCCPDECATPTSASPPCALFSFVSGCRNVCAGVTTAPSGALPVKQAT